MLHWIDFENETQLRWAKEYVSKKTLLNISTLKGEMELVSAIERDCELCSKDIDSFIKPMRASWRKVCSRAKRKYDFSESSRRRYEFNIKQSSHEKLTLLAKSKNVTLSQAIDMLIEEKEVQLDLCNNNQNDTNEVSER